MARWQEFEAARPEMATEARARLLRFGPGLAFLATIRPDGGPRLHPICVCVAEGGIYAWILLPHSPKGRDLQRDGRYALHCFPPKDTDDEFYMTGRVTMVSDTELEERVKAVHVATGASVSGDEFMVEFDIERVLLSTYEVPYKWPPFYEKWVAG